MSKYVASQNPPPRVPKNTIRKKKQMSEAEVKKKIADADYAYHTVGEPIMTDAEYDILREIAETKYGLKPDGVGAPVEKNKVILPYEMASMDKIKPDTGALTAWISKYTGSYVISCKLDGVSGMYDSNGFLYTRGNGIVGQNINHLIPFLKLPTEPNLVIRGEFVIPRDVFASKYKDQFANARNLVAGIINKTTIDDKIYDVHSRGNGTYGSLL